MAHQGSLHRAAADLASPFYRGSIATVVDVLGDPPPAQHEQCDLALPKHRDCDKYFGQRQAQSTVPADNEGLLRASKAPQVKQARSVQALSGISPVNTRTATAPVGCIVWPGDQDAYAIGHWFAALLDEAGGRCVLVGYDGRTWSLTQEEALVKEFNDAGRIRSAWAGGQPRRA